jgi:transposase
MTDYREMTREMSREELVELVVKLGARVEALEAEKALRAKSDSGSVGDVVPPTPKPSKPLPKQGPIGKRRKRSDAFHRPPMTPTEVVVHAVETCPDCGRTLKGGWEHRRRQVIDIPEMPLRVSEHVFMARYCGVCCERHVAQPDLSDLVVGKHVFGVRLMSLVGWLYTVGRVPLRRIQSLLEAAFGLHVALGELTEMLHVIADEGKPSYEAIGDAIQKSEFVHADETGWRENGVSGYVWAFATPRLRFFLYDKSRAHYVPQSVLTDHYTGTLITDFYSGYSFHLGRHQRCWSHFLRDLDDLREAHPDDVDVGNFVGAVRGVYTLAVAFHSDKRRDRVRARERFEDMLSDLAEPYICRDCPNRVLAGRIERFLPELFTFVEYPEVPSENNAAERAIRPRVIARKVSGGTRSSKGSSTRSVLSSLFDTWQAQSRDALAMCAQLLRRKLQPSWVTE